MCEARNTYPRFINHIKNERIVSALIEDPNVVITKSSHGGIPRVIRVEWFAKGPRRSVRKSTGWCRSLGRPDYRRW